VHTSHTHRHDCHAQRATHMKYPLREITTFRLEDTDIHRLGSRSQSFSRCPYLPSQPSPLSTPSIRPNGSTTISSYALSICQVLHRCTLWDCSSYAIVNFDEISDRFRSEPIRRLAPFASECGGRRPWGARLSVATRLGYACTLRFDQNE
jgi:hypothetical protein